MDVAVAIGVPELGILRCVSVSKISKQLKNSERLTLLRLSHGELVLAAPSHFRVFGETGAGTGGWLSDLLDFQPLDRLETPL